MVKAASGRQRSGGDHLTKRSDLTRARHGFAEPKDLLIVEDETFDADRLRATLHVMFGYEMQVRRASTLGSALDCVIERKPDLIFLDDILKPNDTAMSTIPFLRRCGYEGPLIVISGQVTRKRRSELLSAGAAEVIHKDDVDSVAITEALTKVLDALGCADDEADAANASSAPHADGSGDDETAQTSAKK